MIFTTTDKEWLSYAQINLSNARANMERANGFDQLCSPYYPATYMEVLERLIQSIEDYLLKND